MSDIIYPDKLKELAIGEHDDVTTPTKKVVAFGWDVGSLSKRKLAVNSDGRLQVDVVTGGGGAGGDVVVRDIFLALKHILNALNRPLWMEQTTGRLRVNVEGGVLPTITTVGTVSTITAGTLTTVGTLSNLGVGNVSGLHIDRMSWANSVRSRIS